MKQLTLVFALTLTLTSGMTQAKDHEAFKAVQDLFAAMSAFDYDGMKNVVTEDFQLLEVGEDWSIDDLIQAIKPKGKKYQRRNYFQLIRSKTNGNSVWVSYWNKADYIIGKEVRQVAWLESAVINKQDGQWKIQMLHSTRLQKEKVPSDIQWEEYIQANSQLK